MILILSHVDRLIYLPLFYRGFGTTPLASYIMGLLLLIRLIYLKTLFTCSVLIFAQSMQFWMAFRILPLKIVLIKEFFLFTIWNSALLIIANCATDLCAILQNTQLYCAIRSYKQGAISKCKYEENSCTKTIFKGRIRKTIQNCIEHA